MVFKSMSFFGADFWAFFFGFLRFWLDLGRPRGLQKLQKIKEKRSQGAFGRRLGFCCDFWNDFGMIFEISEALEFDFYRFGMSSDTVFLPSQWQNMREALQVAELTLMIRRRGADQWMDGWMDGWRSTNHWKGGWMVRLGPKRLGFRWAAQGAWSLIFTLFFEGVFFR